MIMKAATKKVGSALAALEGVASGGPGTGSTSSTGPSITSTPQTRVPYRVMDETTRKRRLKHELDQLERDNFHDDPHANLTMSKKVPKFDEKTTERRRGNVRLKQLNFVQLVEEDSRRPHPNYGTALAPEPSKFNLPRRRFCGVCGLTGKYACVTCGARFCSTTCQSTHKDTRCMKWIS